MEFLSSLMYNKLIYSIIDSFRTPKEKMRMLSSSGTLCYKHWNTLKCGINGLHRFTALTLVFTKIKLKMYCGVYKMASLIMLSQGLVFVYWTKYLIIIFFLISNLFNKDHVNLFHTKGCQVLALVHKMGAYYILPLGHLLVH